MKGKRSLRSEIIWGEGLPGLQVRDCKEQSIWEPMETIDLRCILIFYRSFFVNLHLFDEFKQSTNNLSNHYLWGIVYMIL